MTIKLFEISDIYTLPNNQRKRQEVGLLQVGIILTTKISLGKLIRNILPNYLKKPKLRQK